MISLIKIGVNKWRVAADYRWEWITVPEGTTTDLGSVPRLLQVLVDDDDGAEGFVVHDYLYANPLLFPQVTRKQAEQIMRKVMKAEGNSWFYRQKAYWGCRLGSGPTWRKYGRLHGIKDRP